MRDKHGPRIQEERVSAFSTEIQSVPLRKKE